jgi:pimeloyl-ACP methyl ester carboxylesterase
MARATRGSLARSSQEGGHRLPTVAVNGITIYYEIHGEGEPLVLIAGLATDQTPYKRLIRELAKRARVIAFDNRGVGRTDKPDLPYSIDMLADDTSGLLTALGIDRANVLGISMGGRIALALAFRHPEQVKSLILVSTAAGTDHVAAPLAFPAASHTDHRNLGRPVSPTTVCVRPAARGIPQL